MASPVLQSSNFVASSGTTCSAPAPSGVVAGDYVVHAVTWADSSPGTGNATISGFVQRGATQHFTGTGYSGHKAWFDSNGADMTGAGPWTVTFPTSTIINRSVTIRVSGTSGWDSTAGVASYVQLASNAALAVAGVTASVPATLALIEQSDGSAQTSSTPSTYTNQGSMTDTYLWWQAVAAAGSTGTPTTTGSGTAGDRLGIIIVYKSTISLPPPPHLRRIRAALMRQPRR